MPEVANSATGTRGVIPLKDIIRSRGNRSIHLTKCREIHFAEVKWIATFYPYYFPENVFISSINEVPVSGRKGSITREMPNLPSNIQSPKHPIFWKNALNSPASCCWQCDGLLRLFWEKVMRFNWILHMGSFLRQITHKSEIFDIRVYWFHSFTQWLQFKGFERSPSVVWQDVRSAYFREQILRTNRYDFGAIFLSLETTSTVRL